MVGGEGAGGASDEGIEQDADREREDALGIQTARPADFFARCRSSRIWPVRLAKTLSITSRSEASVRSLPRFAAVRVPPSSERTSCYCTSEISPTRRRSRRFSWDCSGQAENQPGST